MKDSTVTEEAADLFPSVLFDTDMWLCAFEVAPTSFNRLLLDVIDAHDPRTCSRCPRKATI